jgi:hypothetical protein
VAKHKHSYSFHDLDHGKKVGGGTKDGTGPVSGKGKGKAKAKTSGHVDPYNLRHDAKGHEKGSRGPFKSAGTGHSKSK